MFETDFENFYREYPRKVGKAQAEKTYSKVMKARPNLTPNQVLFKLRDAVKQWKQSGTELKFIPYPSSWLNRYLDDEPSTGEIKELKTPYTEAFKVRWELREGKHWRALFEGKEKTAMLYWDAKFHGPKPESIEELKSFYEKGRL